jgi:hypothetical protein
MQRFKAHSNDDAPFKGEIENLGEQLQGHSGQGPETVCGAEPYRCVTLTDVLFYETGIK